ncbi:MULTISPECIES: transposase [unclassified Lentimonas]|uniref:transposase n=1 Tax=unclassified Lentimonas TaxID=2630993 RepID=UPI0013223981|nr:MULTISPECIES: transposase [unclassified Lentimonas]CAA6677340.1 Putative type IIS restriction /modification enzyme, N-terminal half [Lentimonas sp. CC4]CAA6686885.1 Putative type IIS restriction /modification enzyme, N-terminal half [Lentimonas sp. CC6]CAA7074586.1 Putative type IIS restriction /modification enzyme, N-terminal half [Lentimonas sp. CC4]CAA7169202.1 Putative type IIS restriction /modification enzyme, N-terminal half [Lentimonas sp. CC21]CAA7180397.1 Putative type IIS restrict
MAVESLNTEVKIRSRNLPHWTRDGAVYWVTFRLADSLPQEKVTQLKAVREEWLLQHPEPWSVEVRREYATRFTKQVQAWLDAGYGQCDLARPDVRAEVRDCLLRFDGVRVRLHSAVIMPNHVHAVMEPLGEHQLAVLLKGIKGASARLANTTLGRAGVFWMDESYDRIVRSEKEYAYFLRYIRENPVKAGLREGAYWLYFRE